MAKALYGVFVRPSSPERIGFGKHGVLRVQEPVRPELDPAEQEKTPESEDRTRAIHDGAPAVAATVEIPVQRSREEPLLMPTQEVNDSEIIAEPAI